MRPEVVASWLAYAESDLAVAGGVDRPGVLTETLCFHAQQAAEKAIKAVLVAGDPSPHERTISRCCLLLSPWTCRSGSTA